MTFSTPAKLVGANRGAGCLIGQGREIDADRLQDLGVGHGIHATASIEIIVACSGREDVVATIASQRVARGAADDILDILQLVALSVPSGRHRG